MSRNGDLCGVIIYFKQGGGNMVYVKKVGFLLLAIMMVMVLSEGAWAAQMEKVNINMAPVEELTKLKRISTKYAERIVQYRELNGSFKQPEDIMKVKGIGQKTWELNKDTISVK